MEQQDKWTRFAATGRIQDYLDYRRLENESDTGEKSSYHGGGSGKSDPMSRDKKESNRIVG